MPLKLVCDTNTLVSGFLWRGSEFRLLSEIRGGKAILFTSPELFSEFVNVLEYERLKPFVANAPAIAEMLQSMAVFIKPTDAVEVIREDPADNKVLECALACEADLIVSGDKHLLKLHSFRGMPIVSTKQALERI